MLITIVWGTVMPDVKAAVRMERSSSPMKRKTAFSSRKLMVRQLIVSAMRASAVWMVGERYPRYRPATTTASTPEPWKSCDGMNAR